MKKFLHFLFALTLLFSFAKSANAEEKIATSIDSNELFESVVLNAPQKLDEKEAEEAPVQAAEISENTSLRDKLKNVYKLEIDRYDHPEYLFREPLTYHFKPESKMDNIHVWGAFNADNDMAFYDNGSFKDKVHFSALNIGVDGFLKDNNGDFRIMMGFPVNSQRNYTQTLFADVFVELFRINCRASQYLSFRP